jgi:hypothetical protein
MLIVVVALLGIFRYGAVARVQSLGPLPPEPKPDMSVTNLQYKSGSPAAPLPSSALDRQRIELLEGMLSEKTALLQQQADEIQRRNLELRELRQRYETALQAVDAMQFPADETAADGASGDDNGAETGAAQDESTANQNSEAVPSDPAELEAELMLARAVQDALVEDLDALQREYSNALEEINRLREEVSADTAVQLRDALALEAATAGIILRLGEDAVPALIDTLQHANPVVRRWSATVLGGMGQDAGDAISALTDALNDSDPGVSQAAKAALDAIMR